jgi:mannose-1-phosphate guanylyltransferase
MNIILLSGGSGKRLWPLSNDVRSKQFVKLFKDEKVIMNPWFKEFTGRHQPLMKM